jgi:hypothetical protein
LAIGNWAITNYQLPIANDYALGQAVCQNCVGIGVCCVVSGLAISGLDASMVRHRTMFAGGFFIHRVYQQTVD